MCLDKTAVRGRCTARLKADDLLYDIFGDAVFYPGKHLNDVPVLYLPQPIEVYNHFPLFYEKQTSANFGTVQIMKNVCRFSQPDQLVGLGLTKPVYLFKMYPNWLRHRTYRRCFINCCLTVFRR